MLYCLLLLLRITRWQFTFPDLPIFNRLPFSNSTFVCPTEIIGFSDRAEEFSKINCELIAASTDSHYTHLAWINTPRKEGGLGSLKIPLLADKNAKFSQD